MIDVKKIILKPIKFTDANRFVREYHYSKKIVNNSVLHFGCFYGDRLHGVLSYGSPMDKRKNIGLVSNTKWNEMLELNRMAFDDFLPKNSESRCISVSIKLIKKHYKHIKWILSFSDATQCGDGAIYRASGFKLVGIKKNTTILKLSSGEIVARTTLDGKKYPRVNGQYYSSYLKQKNLATTLPGFQLRYIYLIDTNEKILVPEIPFSKIEELGAGMYKGEKKLCGDSVNGSTSDNHSEGGVRGDLTAQKKEIE